VLTSPTALDLNLLLFILFIAVKGINPVRDGAFCRGVGRGAFSDLRKNQDNHFQIKRRK